MKKIFFACIAFLSFNCVFAQSIDSTLARYGNNYQHEKAYLHYDKASYFAGETVWFKAYLQEDLFPATGSKTFYVDWIDDKGNVLSHTVSPIVDGSTNGQFDIPADYKGNFVHVRGYTKWMLNFDTAFLYSKDIRILAKNTTAKTTKPAIITDLQFFPEGGDVIVGVVNRMAFKANDQYGRPVNVKGVIQDNKGAVADSFRSIHNGMGSFTFIPQEGSVYIAKWKDGNGVQHTTTLPATKITGVSMQVTANGTRRTISINSENLPDGMKQLHIVGTMNQRMAFKTDVEMVANSGVRRVIPTENLPTGILTITLFDAAWNAIAERITFVNNNDFSFQTQMEVKHWGLGKRKRNQVEITIPDSLVGANLSISVTDASIETDSSNNIISHLLLSSEIKGDVYNPAYYFSNNTDSVSQNLDLVMMTHGWRRFKWEDVVKRKMPSITYPRDTSYLSLSGQIFGVTKAQLSGSDNIVLIIKEDTVTKMVIMPVSTNGTFNDPQIILFDTVQIYYSLKSKFFKDAEARFMIERLPAPNYAAFSKNFVTYNPFFDTTGSYHHTRLAAEAVRLQQLERGRIMENVTITTKQKTPTQVMDEKYSSGMFSGGDGYQFDLVNDPLSTAYMNALNYLQGKVAGLQINATQNPPSLTWRGGEPALYLDEISTDASMVTNIPVSDIAYIKVFRPPFMGGFNGGNGAIAIYTRKGNDTQNTPGKGLSSNKVAGYTPIKEFYSPNYGSFDLRNEQPDIRTTLYWNPMIITTQKKNTLTLNFYNNDVAKAFRVIIEGISREGLLTHYEQIME